MIFPAPLVRGRLARRYKRFFADVILDDGVELTVHCPNPGAMLGMNTAGMAVWVSRSENPKRKLAHTLELVEADGGPVGVNTMLPNRLVAEALAASAIPELAGYPTVRAEVKYGLGSRVDFLLGGDGRPPCWVEVKSVTLRRADGVAEFPDCVSDRGLRHLAELRAMVEAGDRAVMLFVVQRADCESFDVAADIDPAYAAGLVAAVAHGVEVLCYDCQISPEGIRLSRPLPWRSAA
jgi:sugar fermentation stimulation protein A